MSDDQNFHENGTDKKAAPSFEETRRAPQVRSSSNMRVIGAALFAVIGTIAIIALLMAGAEQELEAPMTTPQEESFRVPSAHLEPYIAQQNSDALPPAPAVPAENALEIDPLELERERAMQAMALRMAEEKKRREQQRRRAPQIVYDAGRDAASAQSPALPAGAAGGSHGASLMGGGDPNEAFASQYSNADIETATATKIDNLNALIAQGTMISGVLETAIQSDLPGMLRAIVSEDVYSFNGAALLIPKGSRLIGRYRSGLVRGQSRVFVIWTRVLRPDGMSVNIGSYGTDALGRAGLDGFLDTHFFERFGSSILLSLIDASLQIGVNKMDDEDSATVALESGESFSRAAEIALENSIAIPPTIHVDQGRRIKVFVGRDLVFPGR
jgi:type IV secretion system protein VirB10